MRGAFRLRLHLLPGPRPKRYCSPSAWHNRLWPPQAQADSSGMLMDTEAEGFNLADFEGSQDARPGPTAGRHTKRRR